MNSLEGHTSCRKLTDLVGLGVGLDLGDGDTTSSRRVDADDLGVGEARILVGRLVEEVSLDDYLVRNVQRVVGFFVFHTSGRSPAPCSQSVVPFLFSHTASYNLLQTPSVETSPRPTLPNPNFLTHLLPGEDRTVSTLNLERVPVSDEEPSKVGRHFC